ncbi:hypothetical protein RB653_004344 [Dictyostelium firmibasis]|uniref:Uncharacterized protein n=1 Tax=Dictyostelium firmibasis TaxID=79012 RepID=A0AAN7U5Z4_9MYCE
MPINKNNENSSDSSNMISNNKKKKLLLETESVQDEYYEVDTNRDDRSKTKVNSFRYQSFSEKISKVDINIFNKVGDVLIELEHENDSYFHQSIMTWRELNLTQHYNNFFIHIRKYHNSLPEIIIHKDKIIDILLQHISIKNSTALKPLLSILASLSRDLRSEFYGSFFKVLKVLITVLKNSFQSESIEEIFTSICFIFKFLEKQILPNFTQLFEIYSELFLQKRKYIRKFAAESIAFFLRKISFEEFNLTLNYLFGQLSINNYSEEYIDAFSILLFHAVKGVKGKFHSRTEHILPLMLRQLDSKNSKHCEYECKFRVMVRLFQLIKYHGVNEGDNLKPIWVTLKKESNEILNLIKIIQQQQQQQNSSGNNNNQKDLLNLSSQLEAYFNIIKDWMNGSKMIDVNDIFTILSNFFENGLILKTIIENEFNSSNLLIVLAKAYPISTRYSNNSSNEKNKELMLKYLDNLFSLQNIKNSHLLIFQFCTSLNKSNLQDSMITSRLVKYLDKNSASLDIDEMLSFIIRVFTLDENDEPLSISLYPSYEIPNLLKKLESLLINFNKNFNVNDFNFNFGSIWSIVSSLACIYSKSIVEILPILENTTILIESAINNNTISKDSQEYQSLIYLLSQSLSSYIILLSKYSKTTNNLPQLSKRIFNLLLNFSNNINILKLSSIYFEKLNDFEQTTITPTATQTIEPSTKKSSTKKSSSKSIASVVETSIIEPIKFEIFKNHLELLKLNLTNKSNSIRRETISTLKYLHLCTIKNNETTTTTTSQEENDEIQKLFDYCFEIETTQYHLREARGVVSKIDAIGSIYTNAKIPYFNDFLYHYMMGGFYIRFTPIWSAIQKNIVLFCKKDVNKFYPILYKTLQNSEQSILNINKDKMVIDKEEEEEEELIDDEDGENEKEKEDDEEKVEDNNEEVEEEVEEEETTKPEIISFEKLIIKDKLNLTYLFNEILEKLYIENSNMFEKSAKNILLTSTDPINYNSTLWKTMSMLGSLVEGQSKDLIQMFLEFIYYDFNRFTKVFKNSSGDAFDFGDSVTKLATRDPSIIKPYSKSQAEQLFLYYLEFFSQFKRPTKMYQHDLMRSLFYRCLDIDEPKIQFQTLQCYLLWTNPSIQPYKKNLERLIQDKTMREEMTTFIISKGSPNSSISNDHRSEIVEVVVKILLSKLNRKVTRSSIGAQRITIFSYFSGLTSDELKPIIKKLLQPFILSLDSNENINNNSNVAVVNKKTNKKSSITSTTTIKEEDFSLLPQLDSQVYFLNILQSAVKQLGSLLEPFMDQIVKILLLISKNTLTTTIVNSNDKRPKIISSIRSLAFRRFSEILQQYHSWDFKDYTSELFKIFSKILPSLNAYGLPIGLRRCLFVVSSNPKLVGHLNQDIKLLPTILSFINHKPHQDAFLSIIENLLLNVDSNEADSSTVEIYMKVLMPHIDSIINAVKSILLRNTNNKKSSSQVSTTTTGSNITPKSSSLNPSKLSKRHLAILSEVSKFAKSGEQASELLELLIPFLRYNKLGDDDDLVLSILVIFKNMLAIIENPDHHIPTLSTLFGVFKTRLTRTTLSEIFLVLGKKVSYMSLIAPYLEKLNAYTKKSVHLETYDYDKRLEAYQYINDNLLEKLGYRELLPLFINYVYFIKDKDFSIKNSATSGISRLIKSISKKINDNGELIKSSVVEQQNTTETINHFKSIFIPSMRSSFNDKDVRDDYLILFNQLLIDWKGHKQFYPDLKQLLFIGDDEKNFFLNYCHIQKHRKRLSFLQLKNICLNNTNSTIDDNENNNINNCKFSNETINQIILPLSIQAILETSIKDHGSAILGEVVKSLGVLAKSLDWKCYYQVLKKLIKTMDEHPNRFKFFVKSVCEVIDEFHFFINETDVRNELLTGSEIKEDKVNDIKDDDNNNDDDDDDDDNDDEEMGEEEKELREIENDQNNLVTEYNDFDQEENGVLKVSKTQAQSILKIRKKRVIGSTIVKTKNISEEIFQAITSVLAPSLKKHLVEVKVVSSSKMDVGSAAQAEKQKNEGLVNLSIALAILKLYKLLPETTSTQLYPNIIGKLCIGLKSKEYSVRDTTRSTLLQVMETLGYRFFPYILKDMRNVLKNGYQKHILAYTLHALLNTLSKSIEVGVLDSQISLLMDIIIEDLFGEPSVQREIKQVQDTYPEAKTQRSFESLRIIANIIHYSNTNYIIKPIEEIISVSNSPKLLPNLEEMMKKISKGLRGNKSLDFKNLSILTYQFITKGLREKEINHITNRKTITLDTSIGHGHKPTYEETFSIQADPSKKRNERIHQHETHSFIFTELGFSLLIHAIKNQKSIDLEQYRSMIDPFIAYISKCLEHKQPRVVYLSLKCLLKVFTMDLPSVKASSKQLTLQVLKRLQMDSGNQKISNTSYEMATCFLRDEKQEHVNEEQLKAILSLTRQHLTSGEQNLNRSLTMLHVLVNRKVLLPEIYDLMDLCCTMMIRSHQPSIATMISNIFIDFLLFYPMGDTRLKQQITFLIKNLSYEYEHGRLVVLKTLIQIVERFPQEVLNQYALIIYVPLVVRLTSDPSPSCREMVASLIKQLIKGVSVQISSKIYDMTMCWFENGSKNLTMARTSAQIIGIQSECSLANFESKLPTIVAKSLPYIEQCLQSLREKEQSFNIIDEISDDAQTSTQILPGWQLSYSIFTSFEKILTNYPNFSTSSNLIQFWKLSIEFLNYPHIWVRTSLTRLFNIFFTQHSILNLVPIIDQLSITTTNKKKSSLSISPIYNTLFNSNSIFEITKKHCSILNSRLLTDELGLTIIKNLIYLSMLFYKCKNIKPPTNSKDDITPNIFIENIDENINNDDDGDDEDDEMNVDNQEQDQEQEQEQEQEQGDDDNEQPMEEQGNNEEEDDEQISNDVEQESSMLLWLFKRLSYMSTKAGLVRRKYIFRWIAAVSTQLTVQELMPYLSILLIPLIKCTDEKIRTTPQEKKLAQEVIDILKKKIGPSKFMSVYQSIIKATNEMREKRRVDRKIEAIANPKEFLQKKQEKRQLTKEKKRKHKRESLKELLDDRKRIRVSQHVIHNEDD